MIVDNVGDVMEDVMEGVVNRNRSRLLRGDLEAPSPSPQPQPQDTAPLNRVVEATPEATSPRGQHPPATLPKLGQLNLGD